MIYIPFVTQSASPVDDKRNVYPKPDYIQPYKAENQICHLLYFGVPEGECHKLPVDSEFECIYTPVNCCQRVPHWQWVRFQIVQRTERYGVNKGKSGRFYIVLDERELDESEMEFYKALIEEGA